MITGFGNNVVSSLASDITASQTTLLVMPGAGALFAGLLSYDFENPSNTLRTYAKLTLTDSKETSFEVCHLISVSDDVLTVIRGQEGTTAKGWSLNDVVANFATRGSENQFVQIDHVQSGFYCAGVADGSANALMLHLPSSFFVNGSTDWMLRTPVIVYPTQNNTGAATLQLVLGGVSVGTFPLYKGNKGELVAGDILKDVGLVCLLDASRTYFNVSNPGAIYAGLGTAAYRDVGTAPGDVMEVGAFGLGGTAPNLDAGITLLADPSIIGFDATWTVTTGYTDGPAGHSTITGILRNIRRYYDAGCTLVQYLYMTGGHVYIRTANLSTGSIVWDGVTISGDVNGWRRVFDSANLPTALELSAMPYFSAALTLDLDTLGGYGAAGVYYQPADAGATAANHYPVAEAGTLLVTPSAYGCQQEYTTFNSGRKFVRGLNGPWNGTNGPWAYWVEFYSLNNPNEIVSSSANSYRMVSGNHGTFWRQDGANLYLMLTDPGDPYGNYNDFRPFYVDLATGYPVMGRLSLSDYTNFDARYGNKNTAALSAGGGWWQDSSTGLIMQMGMVNRTGTSTTVAFPEAFPNFCMGVLVSLNLYISDLRDSDSNIRVLSSTNTNFVYGANGDPEKTAFWVAFGK